MTVCVIETKAHKFYSGVAVRAPNDEFDLRTGRQISLKRACEAMCRFKVGGHWYYKNYWSEIRAQLRQEREEKNVEHDETYISNAEEPIKDESYEIVDPKDGTVYKYAQLELAMNRAQK